MSEEDIRKSCLSSGHQQQGGRLGEVCVPCMEYDNQCLRIANASLAEKVKELVVELLIWNGPDDYKAQLKAAAERERVLRVALENWVSSWGKGYEMERLSYEEAMIALSAPSEKSCEHHTRLFPIGKPNCRDCNPGSP